MDFGYREVCLLLVWGELIWELSMEMFPDMNTREAMRGLSAQRKTMADFSEEQSQEMQSPHGV